LAIFMTIGIVGLVVGAVLQVLTFTKFKKTAAQENLLCMMGFRD